MLEITHDLIDWVSELAKEAGEAILKHYNSDISIDYKIDGSPLLQADLDAHRIITNKLSTLASASASEVMVVSEESDNLDDLNNLILNKQKQFWLVDPLDGTKEFIKKNGEFTVNIALIDSGNPVLGVIYAPALKVLYVGSPLGAFKIDASGQHMIHVSTPQKEGIQVVRSRSHGSASELTHFLRNQTVHRYAEAGSSLKFCKVAEGQADLYPRLGRTMEWDTAAGHAILVAAGGVVEALDGMPLCYGKKGFENPHFIARTDELLVC
jgi:3'(2'), 5'-bisphosphate nucleotidase